MNNTTERDIDLVRDLLQRQEESSWLEFKQNNHRKDIVGKLCSALSNAACMADREFAYIVWGIHDVDKSVVGTEFKPDSEKIDGQPFKFWLAQRLQPSITLDFKVIDSYQGKRLVILEIPAASQFPTLYQGMGYIRIGETTPKLSDYPAYHKKLIKRLQPYVWEHGVARQYVSSDAVLDLLDYRCYFDLMRHSLPGSDADILEKLEADRLLEKDVGNKWNITNLGAILFAADMEKFSPALARKGVRLVIYAGKNRASPVIERFDDRLGYACGLEKLIDHINKVLPGNEYIGDVFREKRSLFPKTAIRELIANALIHQDMTITGAGPQIEIFQDRIEITNPGKPLMSPDRMIDMPPRSRNESLASLMRRMGVCEEQGSGLDKVIIQVEIYQLPPPLFRASETATQVILYGPRKFAGMTRDERIRACYQHAVLKFLSGGTRMKNQTLCKRFGIERRNAAQATAVIKATLNQKLIKYADEDHLRAGYVPFWA